MKKQLNVLLSALVAASLAGCGSSSAAAASSAAPAASTEAAAASTEAAAPAATDEGKVLNIYVWNNEFANRVAAHYPGFVANNPDDATAGGKIGDVTVNFIVNVNEGNNYQDKLDTALKAQADAEADNKVDIFLVEADYALKYVNATTPVAMSMDELGITADDLADQYQYTKDIVTDSTGAMRGASWQACSAGLIYNRAIAKEVLGSDDPADVQKAVADWDTFNATADKMKDAGYKMTSTVNDTYRVYSNNVSAPWVDGNKIVIDPNIEKWAQDSKTLVDKGETTTADLWSDDWSKGFKVDPGDVFCYFGPAWLINFSMGNGPDKDDDGSISHAGGWGLAEGPQGFYWGGTWICGAEGTDNPSLVKDIILTMTTNYDVLKEIAVDDSDCVNSKKVLGDLAADASFGNAILGGQNPYAQLAAGAEKVDMSNISAYDQGCNESYQKAMKDFFDGNASYDEALEAFYTDVSEKYPALEH